MSQAEISAWLKSRGNAKGTITKLKTFCDNITVSIETEALDTRIERLEEAWHEFKALDDKLLGADQPSELSQIEDKYFEVKIALKKAKNAILKSEQKATTSSPNPHGTDFDLNQTLNTVVAQQQTILNQQCSSNTQIRLPNISIAPFSGNFKDWPSFKDSFQSAIHRNSNLSEVHKFVMLKGLLRGEAESVIKHMLISEVNYAEAWDKLTKRYDKPKQILSSYIKMFLDQPVMGTLSPDRLRKLVDGSDEILRGIRSLGASAEQRDPWLTYLLLSKVDSETRRLWSEHTTKLDFPTMAQLIEFLTNRCDALDTTQHSFMPSTSSSTASANSMHRRTLLTHISQAQSSPTLKPSLCPLCNQFHALYKCPQYKEMAIEKRREYISTHSRCFNCLSSGHQSSKCTSKFSCHFCQSRHHSSLHFQPNSNSIRSTNFQNLHTSNQHDLNFTCSDDSHFNQPHFNQPHFNQHTSNQHSSSSPSPVQSTAVSHQNGLNDQQLLSSGSPSSRSVHPTVISPLNSLSASTQRTTTLLPTALVYVVDGNGALQTCRLLLDSASTWSIISEACVQRLKLKKTKSEIGVNGIGEVSAGSSQGATSLRLLSRYDQTQYVDIENAHVLPTITSDLPPNLFNFNHFQFRQHIDLADPDFNIPQTIDLLVGIEIFFKIMIPGKQLSISENLPVAVETIFGWIVAGKLPTAQNNHSVRTHAVTLSTANTPLATPKNRGVEIEEISTQKTVHTNLDEIQAVKRSQLQTHSIKTRTPNLALDSSFSRFSSLNTIMHIISLLLRMKNKHKTQADRQQKYLSSFTTFVEDHGNFRVGGRLSNSSLSLEVKHIIILPKNQELSIQLIRKFHYHHWHAGATLIVKYWSSKLLDRRKPYKNKSTNQKLHLMFPAQIIKMA